MLVRICEIYRDSPLAILLLHKDCVGQPIWMMDFNNKAGVPKFVNLNLNEFTLLRYMIALSLDNQFYGRVQMKMLTDYQMIKARYVFGGPSEYVLVIENQILKTKKLVF